MGDNLEPRDFGIGTKVKWRATVDHVGPVAGYVDGYVVMQNSPQYGPFCVPKLVVTHASDGAPLGEWVPFKVPDFAGHPQIDANAPLNRLRPGLIHANAIIRGEASP